MEHKNGEAILTERGIRTAWDKFFKDRKVSKWDMEWELIIYDWFMGSVGIVLLVTTTPHEDIWLHPFIVRGIWICLTTYCGIRAIGGTIYRLKNSDKIDRETEQLCNEMVKESWKHLKEVRKK